MLRPPAPVQPVIIVHLSVGQEGGYPVSACSGDLFRMPEDHEYPTIARQLCPGCYMTTIRPEKFPPAVQTKAPGQ
jgi:hypothetical protein